MASQQQERDDQSPSQEPESRHLSGCSTNEGFFPEHEDIEEGEEGSLGYRFDHCEKNPGHPNFIPVSDFDMHHLPEDFRTQENMTSIRHRCDITVRIRVSYTSPSRPDTFSDIKVPYPASNLRGKYKRVRYGTGIINRVWHDRIIKNQNCPCHPCEASGKPKRECLILNVRTATHVIYDDSEAQMAKFDCFFDSDDGEGKRILYGLCMTPIMTKEGRFFRSDACEVLCATHETELLPRLMKKVWHPLKPVSQSKSTGTHHRSLEVIVSHPHGWSKRITLGTINYVTVPIKPHYRTNIPMPFKNGTMCRLPSKQLPSDTGTENNVSKTSDSPIENTKILRSLLNRRIRHLNNSSGDFKTSTKVEGRDNIVDEKDTTVCEVVQTFNEPRFFEVLNRNSPELFSIFKSVLKKYRKAHEEGLDLYENFGANRQFTSFSQNIESHLGDAPEDGAVQALKNSDWQSGIPMNLLRDRAFYDPQDIIVQAFIDVVTQYKKELSVQNEPDINNTKQSWKHAKDESPLKENALHLGKLRISMANQETAKERLVSIFTDWVTKTVGSCIADLKQEIQLKNIIIISEETRLRIHKILNNILDSPSNPSTISSNDGGATSTTEADNNQSPILLPSGMAFILPQDAEYALRYFNGRTGWFKFPPGTKFTFADGTPFPAMSCEAEFKSECFVPRLCYLTYDIDTCPCSSGATVFCDWLQNPDLTLFPHSGSLQAAKKNRSGLLESIPLSKLSAISEAASLFETML